MSLDQPRAVSLVYSYSRANPTAFLQLDATDHSTSPINLVRIRVKDASGAYVTLQSGNISAVYHGKHGANRLAAQWDVSHLPTGAYKHTAIVRSFFDGGTTTESTDTTRIIVVNEAQSPFGSGWSMPGLQRLTIQSDGIVVSEGDGRAVYYRKVGGSYVRPAGEFATLMYVAPNYYRRYPDGTEAVFTSTGLLSYVENRFGHRTTFAYTSGRLTTITDPIGKQFVLAYNGSGKLTSITDPGGRVTTVTVDASGNLTKVVGPDNATAFTGTYDGTHRLRTRKDVRNKVWGYAYDFSGRVSADTLPTITVTDGSTQRPVVRYTPWESAALVSSCNCNRPHLLGDTLRGRVYDPAGNLTRLEFDRFMAPIRIQAPLGHTTIIDRDTNGLPTRIVEPDGTTRSYVWNEDGSIESIQQPETSQAITIDYHPTWKTDPTSISVGASVTRYQYGSSGQLLSVRVGQDSTRYEYDTLYRVKKVVDPQNHTTNITFQSGGFKNTATVQVPGRTTTFGYDSYGRTTSVADPAGTTSYLYDLMNRATRVTDPANQATNYAYDGMFLYTVTDAANKVYRFHRNALGWVTSEVDPNSRTIAYRYDINGNLTRITNRRGQVITMVPDALGRIVSRTADGSTTTFAYDNPDGRWIAASNPVSTDTIYYDERGRVEREVAKLNNRRYEIASSYLPEGPRSEVVLTTPTWSRGVDYGYNNALQLKTLTQGVGGVNKTTNIAYNADGMPSTITYPTSSTVQQTLTYTTRHMPNQNGWPGALAVNYAYDTLDRLETRTVPSITAGDSVRTFTYNTRDELTGYTDEEFVEELVCPTPYPIDCYWDSYPVVVGSDSYSYDGVGNRTDGATLQASSNRYQAFGGYSFSYDLDGNVEQKYKSGYNQYYVWNSLGQLTMVNTDGVVVNYSYNGFGERVKRHSIYDTRYYIYDGDDLALEVNGSGSRLREYTHFPGVDRPHSMFDQNGTVYYYATDYPGHVNGLFNASGGVANRYRYSPWGEPELTSEGVSNTLRFMGRERDWDSGLYYVRNRWYDAQVGRFVSEDPIGLAGGINVYRYAVNAPTNIMDPYGLCIDPRNFKQVDMAGYSKDEFCPMTTLDPVTNSGSDWPFGTPRDEGRNTNPSSRGPYLWLGDGGYGTSGDGDSGGPMMTITVPTGSCPVEQRQAIGAFTMSLLGQAISMQAFAYMAAARVGTQTAAQGMAVAHSFTAYPTVVGLGALLRTGGVKVQFNDSSLGFFYNAAKFVPYLGGFVELYEEYHACT